MRGYQLIVLLTFATSAARGCDAAAALHLHCSTLTRVCYRIASCVDCRRTYRRPRVLDGDKY